MATPTPTTEIGDVPYGLAINVTSFRVGTAELVTILSVNPPCRYGIGMSTPYLAAVRTITGVTIHPAKMLREEDRMLSTGYEIKRTIKLCETEAESIGAAVRGVKYPLASTAVLGRGYLLIWNNGEPVPGYLKLLRSSAAMRLRDALARRSTVEQMVSTDLIMDLFEVAD